MRRLLERLVRNRTITRRIRVKGRSAPIVLSPDAQLSYLARRFDADLLALAERHVTQGSATWDLGANCGVFAVAASLCSGNGTTVAVEPDTWLAELVKRTAGLPENAGRDLRVLCAAVSSGPGIQRFNIAERGRASNFLDEIGARPTAGGVRRVDYVPCHSLDFLLEVFPAPDFVKMDIEGAEVIALKGARRLLTEIRPKMFIETSGPTRAAVLAMMEGHSFVAERFGKNYLFTPAQRTGATA
jgi:FkbM family methyltransferase